MPAAVEAVGKWETRSVFQGGLAAVFSTVPGRGFCKLFRCTIAERRVRTALVVVLTPCFDRLPGLRQAAEPVFIEALVPQSSIETLHVSVLHRSSGLDIVPPDSLFAGPLLQHPAGELRSVVGADLSGQSALQLQPFQHTPYPQTTQRCVHLDGHIAEWSAGKACAGRAEDA